MRRRARGARAHAPARTPAPSPLAAAPRPAPLWRGFSWRAARPGASAAALPCPAPWAEPPHTPLPCKARHPPLCLGETARTPRRRHVPAAVSRLQPLASSRRLSPHVHSTTQISATLPCHCGRPLGPLAYAARPRPPARPSAGTPARVPSSFVRALCVLCASPGARPPSAASACFLNHAVPRAAAATTCARDAPRRQRQGGAGSAGAAGAASAGVPGPLQPVCCAAAPASGHHGSAPSLRMHVESCALFAPALARTAPILTHHPHV